MRIGEREIGPGHPPYVIAEIGVNHDGEVSRALELTEVAAGAGADAVKLQYFETDRLLSKAAKLAAYQRAAGETDPVAMLRRLELTLDEMAFVVECAHGLGIHAIVTVFSVELVERAQTLAWDAYKSASPDVINRPLLGAVAGTGKPLIVSTGASDGEEVRRARRWLDAARDRLAFLHCVSCYPTRDADANLAMCADVKRLVHPCPAGYSDHTAGVAPALLARGFGACILEKHLTYDRRAPGPDHAASLESDDFARYARIARTPDASIDEPTRRTLSNPAMLGQTVKRVIECERDVRGVARQSLTATRALAAGEVIAREDLTIKRPGTGIEPFRLEEIIGRRLTRAVGADMPLCWEDLEGGRTTSPARE